MKKLSVIILASILSFTTFSCADDEDEEQAFPTTGVTWKLNSVDVEINGDDQNYMATQCQLGSTFVFNEDGTFARDLFVDKDPECVKYVQSGTWTENDNRVFTLKYNESENTLDAQKLQITRTGLEELVVESDDIGEFIKVTTYIYQF